MSGVLVAGLTFALILLIYAFIWVVRKHQVPGGSSHNYPEGAGGRPAAGIIPRELTGLRLETEMTTVTKDPEWREWDPEEKLTFGPCLEGERVFSNANGDATLGIIKNKVYKVTISSAASEVDALRARFTDLYGPSLKLRVGWESWEDAATRLELILRGPQVNTVLTDKGPVHPPSGALESSRRRPGSRMKVPFGPEVTGSARSGADGKVGGVVELVGRVICVVLAVYSYRFRWWAPLVVVPLFNQVYEWPFISMKINWLILNRWVRLLANVITWILYFGYIGLSLLLFTTRIPHWYGWLIGLGVGIVVTRFLEFIFPVRWRYERSSDEFQP
jgi:hypothetical protein